MKKSWLWRVQFVLLLGAILTLPHNAYNNRHTEIARPANEKSSVAVLHNPDHILPGDLLLVF